MTRTFLILLFCIIRLSTIAQTTNITLAWDPSPDTGVANYRLHYGTASGAYTMVTNAGLATSITVQDLTPGVAYYFAATAVGTNQLESDFSNEVAWPRPAPPSIPSVPYVKLTPNIDRSIEGGEWFTTNLWPTYLPATNSMELFRGIDIEKVEVFQ